jgi:hypothetical protein
MNKNRFQLHVTGVILLQLLSFPIAAQNTDELGWTETKDKWGQLIFCQRIYKLPEVKVRLYSFDVEQCDKAAQLVSDVIAKYSKQDQNQLKNQAEQHAYKLSHNTSEPYHAVGACREYCGKLAKIKDQRND